MRQNSLVTSILKQLRSESLAVISLVVALSALGYNTWRNELSEQNHTVRNAGMEMILQVSELQSIVYFAHFEQDAKTGNPTQGEVVVATLKDLSMFMPPSVQSQAKSLQRTWREQWRQLGEKDQVAVALIDTNINQLRQSIVVELKALD